MSELLAIISRPWRIRRLKRNYYRLSFQAKSEARKSLDRQIELLKRQRPGYPEDWYLEKIIYDLQRDRR